MFFACVATNRSLVCFLSLGCNIDNRTEKVQVKSFKPLPRNYTLITSRRQRIYRICMLMNIPNITGLLIIHGVSWRISLDVGGWNVFPTRSVLLTLSSSLTAESGRHWHFGRGRDIHYWSGRQTDRHRMNLELWRLSIFNAIYVNKAWQWKKTSGKLSFFACLTDDSISKVVMG